MDRNKVANGFSRAETARQCGLAGERVSRIAKHCSPERRAEAVRLVGMGLSYSKAARHLGMTRNQVAGAVAKSRLKAAGNST